MCPKSIGKFVYKGKVVGQKSSKFLATELLNGPLGLRINNKNWKGPIDAKDFLNVLKS